MSNKGKRYEIAILIPCTLDLSADLAIMLKFKISDTQYSPIIQGSFSNRLFDKTRIGKLLIALNRIGGLGFWKLLDTRTQSVRIFTTLSKKQNKFEYN